MSLALALSSYIALNLLILIGFVGLKLFSYTMKNLKLSFSSVSELKLHYSILLMVMTLAFAQLFIPSQQIFNPPAKIWVSQSIKSFVREETSRKSGYVSLSTPIGQSTLECDQVMKVGMGIAFLIIIFGGFVLIKDLIVLHRIKSSSILFKRFARVRIYINDSIHVPFSYWLPGQANIVIPSSLLNNRADYKIALVHELQHHRHKDTRWVYVLLGLKLICVINPAIYFWNYWISEIQEFACDETLIQDGKVESQSYVRCLVEVAQTAFNQQSTNPACATGLTFLIGRNLLRRRIEKMLTKETKKLNKVMRFSVSILLASIMGVAAYAAKGLVQDRRVSLSEAKTMAEKARKETEFPIVMNEAVLRQLNKYIGTPEGRDIMKSSLLRMENYKGMIIGYLEKYDVPMEILAVPLVESGYQNLREGQSSSKSAGVWQFIAPTARSFGLKVDASIDERLDIELATDAALRYLKVNQLKFKDWQLSVLSYNLGENNVQKGIDKLGTRNVWELIRGGYEGDKDYLAKVMAAIIIMKNPESVK